MSEPVLVVFDVDGTLIDSQKVIIHAMQEAYRDQGLTPPTDAETLSIVGLSLPEAMSTLSPGLARDQIDALVTAYRGSFLRHRESGAGERSVPMYEGALDCLERLNSIPEVILGVATGKARRGLDVVIDAHGLHPFFVTLQTADFHPSKPHPAMLHAASSEAGIGPERAVMIGDTSFDMEMGRAAGFSTLGVCWGYHEKARLSQHADRMVDRFDQVDAAVFEILGLKT